MVTESYKFTFRNHKADITLSYVDSGCWSSTRTVRTVELEHIILHCQCFVITN